jgi:RNA recognition motif-containing protein
MMWILFVISTNVCLDDNCELKYTHYDTFNTEKECLVAQTELDKLVINERTLCVSKLNL